MPLIATGNVSRKTVRASDPTVRRAIHVKPFSIQCESCQAKLKVTKASLVGKRLPCPKCRSSVFVSQPSGLVKGELAEDQDANTDRPEDTSNAVEDSLGGFEDVDDVLSQLPATSKQSKPRPKPQPNIAPEPITSPGTETEPINSELSWDNPAAINTRRTLALAAAAIGTILFIAIGSYAWLKHSSTVAPIDDVALADSDPTKTPSADPTTAKATDFQATGNDNGTSEPTAAITGETTPAETVSTEPEEPKELISEPPIVSSAPPPIDMLPPPEPRPDNRLSVTSPVGQAEPLDSDSASESNPAPTTAPSTSDDILRPVAQASSALSELSSLLEQSGSSVSAITDATASAAAADTIGLPKYYFQTSRSAPVDVERQLSLPCVGLRYNDVSLIEILRDITVISGIPISIDSASVTTLGNATDKRLIPNVSVEVSETTFREAIEAIAQQAGWTSTVNETGVLLTEPDAVKPMSKTIDLSPIAELGDQGLDGVVDSIKAMIAADSWFSDAAQFQIKRNGMALVVQHEPAVVKRVERFISKISAAIQLSSPDAANRESLEKFLKTRLSRAAANLAASCELEIGSRATLDDLLNRIRKKSNVDIIANWQTLSALEWTPLMTVPGNVSEPTVDKMLRQLERSTDSTAIVLDAHTIELTHPLTATNHSYVEFYLIPDLFEQNFTPQGAIQLVQEAIENAGQPAGLTIYEPRCQCVILAAPQSTHRVVEAALLEVRQLN